MQCVHCNAHRSILKVFDVDVVLVLVCFASPGTARKGK